MNKSWLLPIGLLLSLLLAGSTACRQGAKETTAMPLKVTRGDLTITVSGSGTIEVSHDADLSFGVAGRIEKLLIKEGDEVSQGQVIAQLETDSLQLALGQAEVTYAQAQLAVSQYDLAVTQAQAAITQAEVTLKNAEIVLEQTTKATTLSDIRIARAEVETAERNLADSLLTLSRYTPGTIGYEEYQKSVVLAQARLKTAQDKLDAMLSGSATEEVAVKKQQVAAAEQSLAVSRQSLDVAKLTAELSRQSLELAKQSRDYARKQLERATLLVPFGGIIASVPVDEGDTILATTRIAHLVEAGKMELKVQVDEVDIPGVAVGQKAIIKVDALPETPFDGKVSFIGLMPKKEAGVTLFEVKIALAGIENTGLRSGMSASADIVTAERKGVLLVPNRVVKQDSQGNTIVEVSTEGKVEERRVVTGINDGFQIEIVSGLKEGETVVENRTK